MEAHLCQKKKKRVSKSHKTVKSSAITRHVTCVIKKPETFFIFWPKNTKFSLDVTILTLNTNL